MIHASPSTAHKKGADNDQVDDNHDKDDDNDKGDDDGVDTDRRQRR